MEPMGSEHPSLDLRIVRKGVTWRFMGGYKWVISPPIEVITIVILLITLLIAAHEPPSTRRLQCGCC